MTPDFEDWVSERTVTRTDLLRALDMAESVATEADDEAGRREVLATLRWTLLRQLELLP